MKAHQRRQLSRRLRFTQSRHRQTIEELSGALSRANLRIERLEAELLHARRQRS